ncbi:MAG: hypothetical protein AAFN80_00645 [Pseudomonadota bacterium]
MTVLAMSLKQAQNRRAAINHFQSVLVDQSRFVPYQRDRAIEEKWRYVRGVEGWRLQWGKK